jgi:predicted nucleotidyltransferase
MNATGLSMTDLAFLSFRLPKAERDRLKALAHRRNESVQDLMRRAAAQLLANEDREPPRLADILRQLRERKTELQQKGIEKLWIFGSVARGDATPQSDVDLVAEFRREPMLSLTRVLSIGGEIEDFLGSPVQLAQWSWLPPKVRETAERDAVPVF